MLRFTGDLLLPVFDSVPYWKAEEEARAAKRGMWAQGDKYVSPREWRRASGGK